MTCFPDKVFGAGEDRVQPSFADIRPEFPEDFDCWVLVLDPVFRGLDLEQEDHGVGPYATYAFGHIREGRLVESLDFDQFLSVLGFQDESSRSADVSY